MQHNPELQSASRSISLERLEFPCPSCGKRIVAPAAFAGRVGSCKGCGTKIRVPQAPASVPQSVKAIEQRKEVPVGDADAGAAFSTAQENTPSRRWRWGACVLVAAVFVIAAAVTFLMATRKPTAEELVKAAEAGDVREVERLLAAGADPNVRHYSSALAAAALENRTEVVCCLLKYGAHPEGGVTPNDFEAVTPLEWAVLHENLEMTKWLLGAGANPNWPHPKDKHIGSAVHCAATQGNESLLRLLAANRGDVNLYHRQFGTPLHVAIAAKHPHLIPVLVSLGARVNVPNPEGATPLKQASDEGDIESFNLLLKYGGKYEPDGPPKPNELAQIRSTRGSLKDTQYSTSYAASSPQRKTADSFLAALASGKLQKLTEFVVPEERKQMAAFFARMQPMADAYGELLAAMDRKFGRRVDVPCSSWLIGTRWSVGVVKMETEDEAVVTLKQESQRWGQPLNLKKINGAWLVQFNPHDSEEDIKEDEEIVAKVAPFIRNFAQRVNAGEFATPEAVLAEVENERKHGGKAR
jgi:uncharacterized protein